MRYTEQPLQTFRLRNFKAVRDSGAVKFTPLTVFIGNNGSGKSSLIEGLETFQSIIVDGLDEAMNRWRGFEFIYNEFDVRNAIDLKSENPRIRKTEEQIYLEHPLRFDVAGRLFRGYMEIAAPRGANRIGIRRERVKGPLGLIERDADGKMTRGNGRAVGSQDDFRLPPEASIYEIFHRPNWQFIDLEPTTMIHPRFSQRVKGQVRLRKDGSNIADYLNDIRERDSSAFDSILETLRFVLPYAEGLRSAMSSEVGRQRFIQLEEGRYTIPGWLLSTGTIRILALLAVLRHPSPPPVVFIEEIENGLDPRTVRMIMDEIAYATENGITQVVCTTHSPFLLNAVDVSSVVIVERDETNQPTFSRYSKEDLAGWADTYRTGELYLKGQLQGRKRRGIK